MPCFNEQATLKTVMARVLDSPWVRELLVVDDGSTDASLQIARSVADPRVRVFAQGWNKGKGAAIRRCFSETLAPYVVIQDANLEYDPQDYANALIADEGGHEAGSSGTTS